MQEVKPIIDPMWFAMLAECQLKLSSVEGIDRGAIKLKFMARYAATPTRLFEDAPNHASGDFGFHAE